MKALEEHPSNRDVLFAGTEFGLYVTFNGGRTWTDVTPPALRQRPWSKISIMDASHFDTLTAYAGEAVTLTAGVAPQLYVVDASGEVGRYVLAATTEPARPSNAGHMIGCMLVSFGMFVDRRAA